jgi:hypothetical protein
MAQVTYTFNTDEDIHELRRVTKAKDMAFALHDLKNYFRGRVKYAPESMPDGIFDELVKIEDIFQDVLEEYNINIDDLLE